MVLADPGMGKSTLLRMEAGSLAQAERQKLKENNKAVNEVIFPLFLRLSELEKTAGEIIDAIPTLVKQYYPKTSIRIDLKKKLDEGKCCLLLDALDEVPKEQRNDLAAKLNRFARNYSCPMICTSRIVGYGGTFVDGTKEVEIVPFSQKQTEKYIEKWFTNAADYIDDDSVSAEGLIRELRHKPQIGGLAQNPLLLSLLCSLYQEKGLTLPARRTQVYKKAVDYMLNKWSQNREPQSEGKIQAKIRLLEQLAYHFTCEGKEIFSLDDLYDQIEGYLQGNQVPTVFRNIDSDKLITELSEEDGILQKLAREGDQYLFLHRTFQEYLTAAYLNRATNRIALAKEHFWEYDWHETLSLLAGLMESPIPLLQAITTEKDDIFSSLLLLAGRCLAECQQENSHPLIVKMLDRIYGLWQSYPSLGFVSSTVIALVQTNSQMSVRLQNAFNDEDSKVKWQAAWVLGRIGSLEAVEALSNHGDSKVRVEAVRALTQTDNPEPDAVKALFSALEDHDRSVRGQADRTFIPDTLEVSIERFNHKDKISNVKVPIDALNNRDRPTQIKVILGFILLHDEDSERRRHAAQHLGWICRTSSDETEVVRVLISALRNDNDSNVRAQAAWALGRIGSPQAMEALISALRNDEDNYVRAQAAWALSQIGTLKTLRNLIKQPEIDIYNPDIFLLARTLAVRFSKEKVPFPVYPELVGQ